MARRYAQLCHLNDHEDAITAVAFSTEGTFLATGSLDGRLCVWNVQEGRLLYRHLGEHEISSIAWLPDGENELLFGTKRGHVVRLTITPVRMSPSLRVILTTIRTERLVCWRLLGTRTSCGTPGR